MAFSVLLALALQVLAAPASRANAPRDGIRPRQDQSPSATCAAFPAVATGENTKLPDPFTFLNGTRAQTETDWQCRRQEINVLLQNMELGIKPEKPPTVQGTLSNGALTITCATSDTNSITFTPTVTYPSIGTAPYPALIGIGGISIPTPTGVAVITLNNNDLGLQNDNTSRNAGKFFNLYGPTGGGAMIAWAWGVSRIVDVLEDLGSAQTRIDTSKLGVTGCSRNGKGALVAGALDDRIALTIPQESGSGGSACWRLSDAEDVDNDTQTAAEIVQENVWFSTNFTQYASTSVDVLPFDHHMLAGLVAPRGFLSIDNTAYQWLGPMSDYGCMKVASTVWQALGVEDRMGESQVGNHSHCVFPADQQGDLDAFVNRFLRGQDVNTDIFRTQDGNFTFNEAQWVDWSVPVLS